LFFICGRLEDRRFTDAERRELRRAQQANHIR
jgi:hypothetical protein